MNNFYYLFTMLNKEELRKQVIQYFRSVGSGQNILQCIKEALFLHQKFSPLLLFQVLSRGKQKLIASDFRHYLSKRSINFSEDQLRYYLRQNNFGQQVTLNEFLEATIPYNADVVREFKSRYLQSLEIKEFDPEVEFIFSELIENQIKFYRSLINVRQDISNMASQKQIEALVKQDLVVQSKPREARKFHEGFQVKGFVLGFHQLRKFLEIWLSSKEILHEFYLLNIMRHLKSNCPFQRIVFKNKGQRSKSAHRSHSAKHRAEVQLTNQKIRAEINKDQQINGDLQYEGSNNKYSNFKNNVMNQYRKEIQKSSQKKNKSPSKESIQKNNNNIISQALRRSKYERQAKGIDASFIIQILEQIVLKEERLEKLRKNLAKCDEFNLINLNKLIDFRNKGYITAKDFGDYTSITRVQFNHMVSFYAREEDKLRFHEFCLIFRPLSKQLNEAIDRRPQHKVPNPFKKQTTKLIFQVITLTAEMHSNLAVLRQKINRSGQHPSQYFRFIDLNEKGYINAQCFKDVLIQNNIFCDDKDLKCLMKFFKKKVDERVTLQQFSTFLDL